MTIQQKQGIKKIVLVLVLVYALPVLALGIYKLLRPKTIQSGQVQYQLAWDTSGVQNSVWKTNLGYTVRLEQGFLVSYGVQLMACPHSHSWLETLLSGLGNSQTALAGHPSAQDPAAQEIKQLESLTVPKSSSFAPSMVHEPNYCQGFYVVSKTVKQLDSKSLFLRGTYEKNGKTKAFTIESDTAFGDLHPLVQAQKTVHVTIGAAPIRITFLRRLSGLFDNLEFESGTALERSLTVLRNLHKNTRVLVESGQAHAQ
jgi:hypothetical protein